MFFSVMRGLGPRIPLMDALSQPERDGRDKPGHDVRKIYETNSELNSVGAEIVRTQRQ